MCVVSGSGCTAGCRDENEASLTFVSREEEGGSTDSLSIEEVARKADTWCTCLLHTSDSS